MISLKALVRCLLFTILVPLLAACGGDEPAKGGLLKGCNLNSDCKAGLVCGFGLCHAECVETEDCPAGQRCITVGEANACQLPEQCDFNSDCKGTLVCGPDGECREQCMADRDCPTGQVCASGVCAEPDDVNTDGTLIGADGGTMGDGGTTCTPGGECTPEGAPCHAGVIVCEAGAEVCSDDGNLADGASCGTDQVCDNGACVGCVQADECLPDPQNPCVLGTLDCAAGPACSGSTPATDGTSCGTDQVCDDGACVACVEDQVCEPDALNPCVTGAMSCASGPLCEETGDVMDGTSCGTDQVCSVGSCVACVANEACTPSVPCREGTRSCVNGPQCVAGANLNPGASCGTNLVCDSGAQCVACTQDQACVPTNECHQGQMDCANGPSCVDQALNVDDGTVCDDGFNYFCTGGVCGPCAHGSACTPTNVCKVGQLYCYGAPMCNETGADVPDGVECGPNQSCITGVCTDNDRVLSVNSGGGQSAPVDAQLSATVNIRVVDGEGANVAGVLVSVEASEGAYAAPATSNASGIASIVVRVGRAIGTYTFHATAPGATPVDFTADAIAPTAKHIFTAVNVSGEYGAPELSQAGTMSHLYGYPQAVAARADGTLYIGSYCQVLELTPAGELRNVAGSAAASCGNQGDGGLATSALLNSVGGLAIDETNDLLYVSDTGNARVRLIDLNSGLISHFAGGGDSQPPYGDGGPAESAYVGPSTLSVAPNGNLYISDSYTSRIRKVDFNSSIISTFVEGTTFCDGTPVFKLVTCGGAGQGCAVAWDSQGQAFISGSFCGAVISSPTGAIARVDGNELVHIAGDDSTSGSTSDGVAATTSYFSSIPQIAFDEAGNLFLSISSESKVRRIDGATGKISTVAGNGTAAYVGQYVAATSAQLYYPYGIAFDGAGNLHIADGYSYAVRSIWALGSSTPSTVNLALVSGNAQSVAVDNAFGAVTVKVTDGAAANVSGVDVQWERLDEGMGLFGTAPNMQQVTKTNAQGNAVMTGRVGLAVGTYDFRASYFDIHGNPATGSPVALTATATAPTAGTMFTIVNVAHTYANSGTPGPGTFARVGSTWGGVAAADGTLYLSESCSVLRLSVQGELTVVAGIPGGCGFGGDAGPAVDAELSGPHGLALDETNNILYIADKGNHRVRMVFLDDGTIDTFAGGGNAPDVPYGDGGPATSASLSSPSHLALNSAGDLYIVDVGHDRVRIVSGGIIDSYVVSDSSGCSSPIALYSIASNLTDIVPLAAGAAYISAYLCGSGIPGTYAYGIVHRAGNGTLTRIAGIDSTNGSEAEGVQAVNAYFPDIKGLAYNSTANTLAISMGSGHKIRRINLTTGAITTIVGTGVAGSDPDYGVATASRLNSPQDIFYTPSGRLVIADYSNYTYRMVW